MAVRKHLRQNIDLSTLGGPEELRQACRKYAGEEMMAHLTLTGTPQFFIDAGALAAELEPYFFHLEIINDAHYFAKDFLDNIAVEPTVRGTYVRRIREKQKNASTEREQKVLELALLKGLAALEGSDRA